MAYFDTKSGSLEEAIRQAVGGQINENQYYEYQFKNKNDAMAAKKMLDAVQLMSFDINDDNISGGELMVDAGNKNMSKYHKQIMQKFKPKVMKSETNKNDKSEVVEAKMDAVNKTAVKKKFDDRKDKDIDNDGDVDSSDKFLHKRRKAISKAMSKDEGNKFTGALNAAKEKGEKTFVVSGKTYNVEDYQKEEVDLEEGKMKDLAMKIASVYTKMKKDKQMKPFADKFRADVKTSMNIRKSLEKVLPDYVGGGNITKLMGENFIGTPENTKARLDATPGQSSDDWNEQVGVMQKKNDTMREALAKMWGLDQGHNPFVAEADFKPHMMYDPKTGKGYKADTMDDHLRMKKMGYNHEAPKKEGKTMTGQPETKVSIDPDMKEKVK